MHQQQELFFLRSANVHQPRHLRDDLHASLVHARGGLIFLAGPGIACLILRSPHSGLQDVQQVESLFGGDWLHSYSCAFPHQAQVHDGAPVRQGRRSGPKGSNQAFDDSKLAIHVVFDVLHKHGDRRLRVVEVSHGICRWQRVVFDIATATILVSSPRLWFFFGTNAWILEDVSIDEERCLFSNNYITTSNHHVGDVVKLFFLQHLR
mmetsp:Transcript_41555/g.65893  ORF Transcript_41555/g.65893 Transcript_41555/m.65893 type:complete len:207 (-) Transcript_41555:1115-1735(-)